jgi:hypothetical protein
MAIDSLPDACYESGCARIVAAIRSSSVEESLWCQDPGHKRQSKGPTHRLCS